ncbi:MAG: shikimate dehydrogenase [Steroidobacteraceae bacterium]
MNDRYAVIGQPISHSRSPWIHARFARQTQQDIQFDAIEVVPARLTEYLRHFFADGGKGLSVTLPHKQAVTQLVQELTPRAAQAGAINTILLRQDGALLGDNTDGAGLVRDLTQNLGISIVGRRLLLLGAGGAARGVLLPLLGLAPQEIFIANRSPQRAHELVERFSKFGKLRAGGFEDVPARRFDLVINATAANLAGEKPTIPVQTVGTQTFCYDLAYANRDTPFLSWAQERGCARAVMGLGMLVEQAAEQFQLWREVRPDTSSVLVALRAQISSAAAATE